MDWEIQSDSDNQIAFINKITSINKNKGYITIFEAYICVALKVISFLMRLLKYYVFFFSSQAAKPKNLVQGKSSGIEIQSSD